MFKGFIYNFLIFSIELKDANELQERCSYGDNTGNADRIPLHRSHADDLESADLSHRIAGRRRHRHVHYICASYAARDRPYVGDASQTATESSQHRKQQPANFFELVQF